MSTPNAVASVVLIVVAAYGAYVIWADAKRRKRGRR